MKKELEAFEKIKLGYIWGQGAINEFALRENERENFSIVETTLKDYERIMAEKNDLFKRWSKEHQVLEIIKNKRVEVFSLIACIELNEFTALETYNIKENCHNYKLTQEEFDLLKEMLLCKK